VSCCFAVLVMWVAISTVKELHFIEHHVSLVICWELLWQLLVHDGSEM